jgi:hypothetical protein
LEVLSSLNQLGPTHKKVLEEERLVLGRQKDLAISSVLDLEKAAYSGQGPGAEPPDELIPRKTFFDLAYRHREVISMEGSYWATLQENWLRPNRDALSELAVLARKQVDLYRLCYIHTLAQFSGEDTAALKLLDFIRATDLVELQAVIHALAGIGTPRAIQEMISALTRPNMSHSLRLEVCHLLQDRDLSKVQLELRSAIKDLSVPGANPQDQIEIKELLEDFLLSSEISQKSTQGMVGETESIDLDRSLTPKIPHYQNLSSEVRRALRTAQFFDQQVQKSGSSAHSIDLSPAIDMQYKALELTFREIFEQECFQVINNGILQRKLDVIGYARPIPNAMDNFEGYMASLPVVKDTPYFSKFKLRKMLRAICQYRPGKRFTLDGIKAFSLFFLCFGRKNCQFGLEQIIDLGFANDAELAEFCKTLHIFQDLRNRAAHEGFHPDAHNDIDGIWKLTGDIVAGVFSVKEKFKFTPPQLGHFGPAKQQPIIERRSSPKQAS